MSEHTKEPWRVGDGKKPFYAWAGQIVAEHNFDGSEFILASCNQNHEDEALANARRIVACVNSCRGIQTELLEQDKGPFQHLGEVLRERDEALALVKELVWKSYCAGYEQFRDEECGGGMWPEDLEEKAKSYAESLLTTDKSGGKV